MYKLFIGDSFISTGAEPQAKVKNSGEEVLPLLPEIIDEMLKGGAPQPLHLVHEFPGMVWDRLVENFTRIDAAGGLVERPDGRVLMMYRLGHWDLPKGKLEEDESPDAGAVREVEEECGIHGPVITEVLPETWHAYRLRGERIIKCTYWFRMTYQGWDPLVPQKEEGIERLGWFDRQETEELLRGAYPAIRELFASLRS